MLRGLRDVTKLKALDIASITLFAALTAIGAYITIPLPYNPVPITLQTFFTYLAGAVLGGYLGALSQLIYVLLGVVGLPVFARGYAGIAALLGPTGGYLLGFIPGAFVIGKLVEMRQNPSFRWLLFSMSLGTVIIYLCGAFQLMAWLRTNLYTALAIGVLPFIVGDTLKMLLAAYVAIRVRKMFYTHASH